MDFLSYFQLNLIEIYYVVFIVFIASIIRGFNGFGFSATCISLISFILPTIEIVPIILILEVFVSVFMVPYIWTKIDWKFVFQILLSNKQINELFVDLDTLVDKDQLENQLLFLIRF